MVNRSLCRLAVCSLVLSSVASCRAAEADWTMMMYLACDNDLEAPQLQDLEEMLTVGSTDRVQIIALCDRSESDDEDGGYSGDGIGGLDDWTGAKLLHVERHRLVELDDWGDTDSGDPATLQEFIETATELYPASHYALVLGDHGMAWPGICADEGTGNMLSTQELAAVLDATSDSYGRLSLLGFDACLMGNLETAYALSPYAEVMVASEELEPGDGWAYDAIYRALAGKPAMSGAELGRVIADSFYASYAEAGQGEAAQVTLSVIDLDRVADLTQAVNNLAEACGAAIEEDARAAWLKIAKARSRAEQYGLSGDDQNKEGEDDADAPNVRDVGDFARLLKAGLPAAGTAADTVLELLGQAVVYKVAGSARPRSSGLSIYFPPSAEPLADEGPDGYAATEFAQGTVWPELVDAVAAIGASDTDRPGLGEAAVTDTDLGVDEEIEVTAEVDADDLDEAYFVLALVDGDEQLVLGKLPTDPDEDGKLRESWDGGWFTITSGETALVCPIINLDLVDEDTDTWYIEVPAELYRGEQIIDVSLFFVLQDTDNGTTGEFVAAYKETRYGAREVRLRAGDRLQPIYLTVDAEGNETEVVSDDAADALVVGDGLEVAYEEVDPGTYLIGFVTSDLAGNVAESYVEVEVE